MNKVGFLISDGKVSFSGLRAEIPFEGRLAMHI